MALIPLKFIPGVNKDVTNYAGEGGWVDSEKVRFRAGYPQKIGGWTKYMPTQLKGVCRQMWNWVTTFADVLIVLGTHSKVYLEAGLNLYDITPIRASFATNATDNMVETTDTSTTVTINLTAHGSTTDDFVTIGGVTGVVGGVPNAEINANHEITVVDDNTFTIVVATAATSTVGAGGGTSITAAFEIMVGFDVATEGYGWGTDAYATFAWGLGTDTPVVIAQRDWWFGNIDNDIIMSIRNGSMYYWVRGSTEDPSSSLATRAVTMQSIATSNSYDPNAVPVKSTQILLSQDDRHLIAFGAVPYGSTDTGDFDPLLIRWASQDAPSQWTPKVTNSAGDLRISRGSLIVCAVPTRQQILVWTDSNLYALQFLGTTDVFSLDEYADFISIVSPRAAVSADNATFWMGKDKFYVYDGRVKTLPCTLLKHVFKDFNLNQAVQVVSGTNEEWNEVWWFYTSGTANANDRYIVYNYKENLWYHGTMTRTAWMDSSLKPMPIGYEYNSTTKLGYVFQHEDGIDADGSALSAHITSHDFDLGDGDRYMLSRRIIPDIDFVGSTAGDPEVTIQVKPKAFPGGVYGTDTADTQSVIETTVGVYTNQVFIRARARQMAIKIASANTGVMWQLGNLRIDLRQDGRQ